MLNQAYKQNAWAALEKLIRLILCFVFTYTTTQRAEIFNFQREFSFACSIRKAAAPDAPAVALLAGKIFFRYNGSKKSGLPLSLVEGLKSKE